MRTNLLIFIFLLILVVLFHYLLDSSYLNFGMHSDDWISLVRYKLSEENLLDKIQIFWKGYGPHVTSQVIYIGILESLFGLNYKIFDLINIFFKILATLSVYPLILLVFRRKLLAFLTVVLYSISYSTIGTFHDVIKGTEYQAIFFMNTFLIVYYLVTKKQIIYVSWIFALILSFSMAILLAPPRLFPLIGLPLLIEFFLWVQMGANYNLKFAIKKLFYLYLPFVLLFIYRPPAITGFFVIPVIHIQKILEGYWFTVLMPISGLGYMMLWDTYWVKLIGSFNLNNFGSYLFFLISKTTVVFGLLSVFFALILSKKRRRFIFLAIVLNLFFEILIFSLATNHLKIPVEYRRNFDFNILYSVFVGLFMLVVSISCFIEWLAAGKKNGLFLALVIGPLFSFYFIFCNFLFADSFLTFGPSQEYLTVPAIGVSLFFSALLISIYDEIKTIKILHLGESFAIGALLLLLVPIYTVNKMRTTDWLSSIIKQNNAIKQQDIQQKIRGQIKGSAADGNSLVFFDWANDKVNAEFYSETIYSSFPSWIHYINGKLVRGCINGVFDKETLANSIAEMSGKKGFILPGVCLDSTKKDFFTNQEVFYEMGDFYAFEINNNNISDIRDNVLKSIGIN